MDSRAKIILEMIKEKGYKLTQNRKALVDLFLNEKEHLRVKEIHHKLHDYKVSLSSVYRNIEILDEIGVINSIVINNEIYYELKLFSHKRVHLHFRCNNCKAIKEYSDSDLVKMVYEQKEMILRKYGDEVSTFSIVYEGICSNCKHERHM